MFFSDRITLRTTIESKDADGYSTISYQDLEVWANRKSVKRTEFYAANANGINAVIAYDVRVEDYSEQREIIDGSKQYDVIRTYQKGEGIIELTCSEKLMRYGRV